MTPLFAIVIPGCCVVLGTAGWITIRMTIRSGDLELLVHQAKKSRFAELRVLARTEGVSTQSASGHNAILLVPTFTF